MPEIPALQAEIGATLGPSFYSTIRQAERHIRRLSRVNVGAGRFAPGIVGPGAPGGVIPPIAPGGGVAPQGGRLALPPPVISGGGGPRGPGGPRPGSPGFTPSGFGPIPTGFGPRPGESIPEQTQQYRRHSRVVARTGANLGDAAITATGLGLGLVAATKASIGLEDALADVRKVTDFTDEGFDQFARDIRDLSLRVPVPVIDLVGAAEFGGRRGFAEDALIPFVEETARLGTALGIPIPQLTAQVSGLQVALGLTREELSSYLDTVNVLDNQTPAFAKDIIEIVSQQGALAQRVGVTKEGLAALGTTLLATNVTAEEAFTAIRNVLSRLAQGEAAPKQMQEAFERLGFTVADFAEILHQEGVGAFGLLFDQLEKMDPVDANALILDVFEMRAGSTVAKLLAEGPRQVLNQALGIVADEAGNRGSVLDEFNIKLRTTRNQLTLAQNEMVDFGTTSGNVLLPGIVEGSKGIGGMFRQLGMLAEQYPDTTRTIVGSTVALVAFSVVAGVGRFVIGTLVQTVSGAISVFRFLGKGLTFVGPLLSGTAELFTKGAFSIGAFAGKLGLIGRLLVFSGVGAAIAAFATAGVWIYNNWSNIKALFKGVGDGFREAFKDWETPQWLVDTGDFITRFTDNLTTNVALIAEKFGFLVGTVEDKEGRFHGAGQRIGAALGGFVRDVLDFPGKVGGLAEELYLTGVDTVQGWWDGWIDSYRDFKAWLFKIPDRTVSTAIGDISINSLWQAGRDLIQGLWDGAKSIWTDFRTWAKEQWDSVVGIFTPPEISLFGRDETDSDRPSFTRDDQGPPSEGAQELRQAEQGRLIRLENQGGGDLIINNDITVNGGDPLETQEAVDRGIMDAAGRLAARERGSFYD